MALNRWYSVESNSPRMLNGSRYLGSGRLWEWCSTCHTFEYYPDGYVPEWWVAPYQVDAANLRYDPGPIEDRRAQVFGAD
jgi:hypothetical protein